MKRTSARDELPASTEIRSGCQVRAGRALVGMTQGELARIVGTSPRSIRAWEARDRPPSDAPIFSGKIRAALEARGVVFIDRPTLGVRLSASGNFGTRTRAHARDPVDESPVGVSSGTSSIRKA